jgi:hypothetical protein
MVLVVNSILKYCHMPFMAVPALKLDKDFETGRSADLKPGTLNSIARLKLWDNED